MNLRNLVTGSDVCAPSDGARRGNILSDVSGTLLERTRANDRNRQGGTSSNVHNFFDEALSLEEQQRSTQSANEAADGTDVQSTFVKEFQQFQKIFDRASIPQGSALKVDAVERDRAVFEAFKQLMHCAREDVPFAHVPSRSGLTFDPIEQQKMASRVQHLCHVIFADRGPDYAEMQTSRFLESMCVSVTPSEVATLHQAWNESNGVSMGQQRPGTDQTWVDQFSKLSMESMMPSTSAQHPWLSNFGQEQKPASSSMQEQDAQQTKDISSALIDQMANDPDPKFRESRFLKFVQQLNSGELVIDGNEVKKGRLVDQWAAQFASQMKSWDTAFDPSSSQAHPWLSDFKRQGISSSNNSKVGDTLALPVPESMQKDYGILEGGWVDSQEIEDWLENYHLLAYGPVETKEYEFAADNPFMGNPESFSIAQESFTKGVLSEATLAAEAAAKENEGNVEAWIALGKIHAENDNDPQAIAALKRARSIDPTNLTVLLDLGVCHANEHHEQQTVEALMSWMRHHPIYSRHQQLHVQPPGTPPRRTECLDVLTDRSQAIHHAMQSFHQLLTDHADDANVLIALGVLHHLGRNFTEAIALFTSAVRLRPDDYALWNKLGATQANAAKSGEAIVSYRQSLQQRPHYMRVWANLGISYANLGDHVTSVQHYIEALSLNPSSETVWGYLKSSAICAGFADLLTAIDTRDIEFLRKRFPL